MATKQQQENNGMKKIRDLNPYGRMPYGIVNHFSEYFSLLLNAVKIVPKAKQDIEIVDDEVAINYDVETYVKTLLFNGCAGYDKITKKWYNVYGEGINEIGNPRELIFLTANGSVAFSRPAYYDKDEDGAYIIYGLPNKTSMVEIIKETTDFMENCDLAMRQNLEACKTPYIVVCKNKNLMLSYQQAIREKQEGQAVVLVSEELGEGLKAINIGVEYLVDKFSEIYDWKRDTLLNKFGIITSNNNKKERIQSAEVNATLGQATDYIYLVIDTFNKQMESYDIPYEMKLNGSLEDIYFNEDAVNDVDVNEVEDFEGAKAND